VLSQQGLDSTLVTAEINGTVMNEGSGLTVDRVNGKITFTTAPILGTDNVIITAYKTVSGLKERIAKCTLFILFGGENDTRIILSGNPDSKAVIYRSGIYDPTYFPENTYEAVGNTYEAITGFKLQYDTCIIEKSYSKWCMNFEVNSDGIGYYPIRPLNDIIRRHLRRVKKRSTSTASSSNSHGTR
jgi:hypothetical protein